MKKIKDSIAAFIYRIILVVVKLLPASAGNNHLLIIKVDEIGDYMLFRNLLQYFRQSERYKNCKITILGNTAWKSIFDKYDVDTIDNAIWITKKKFNRDLLYRFNLLKQIRYLRTSEVVNCIYSRSILLDDGFAFVAKGKKTTMEGHNSNRGKYSISVDKFIYDYVIDAGSERIFDSIRNANFVGRLLQMSGVTISSHISISNEKSSISQPYCLIFIGAGNPERKWPIEKFIQCAEYAFDKYSLATVICGGPADKEHAEKFMVSFQGPTYDFTAKTSLLAYMELVSKSKFVISVDTGPMHIAAAENVPVIGLFSGKYYRRYAPYPKEINENFYPVYPDFVDKLIEQDSEILYDPFATKNNTIHLISADKVIRYIDAIMSNH
jgi:ADP-heptose:LPS heptosyltransferase